MNTKATHRLYIIVLLFITAVVLCTLPFLLVKKDTIYVYTKNLIPDSRERGLVLELKELGYEVKVNQKPSKQKETALWFRLPHNIKEIMSNTKFTYNFIYNEEYYPFEYENLEEMPILLTPYQDLYEHYMRQNIKSATFVLGANQREYNIINTKNKTDIVYYENRNKDTNLLSHLTLLGNVKFLGRFWNNNISPTASLELIAENENKILSKAKYTIIDNHKDNNLIPEELLNASLTSTLILTPSNSRVYNIYKDSIIYFDNPKDIEHLISYYEQNSSTAQEKSLRAQNITANQLSSSSSAKRFQELLNWLKFNKI